MNNNQFMWRRIVFGASAITIILTILVAINYKHPYERLAIAIEQEFPFVDVVNVDRLCVGDCDESYMILFFYPEGLPPSEDILDTFGMTVMNGLYALSNDEDDGLILSFIDPPNIEIWQVTCQVREYLPQDNTSRYCRVIENLYVTVPINEDFIGR